MTDDCYDDGLVHSHGWTAEARPPHERVAPAAPPAEPDHDDGLVHSHDWACTERGQPATNR